MSVGREDYWGGFYSMVSVGGNKPIPVFQYHNANVPAGDIFTMISYVVPDGYILYIHSLFVSCDFPGINWFYLGGSGVLPFDGWFDTNFYVYAPEGLVSKYIATNTCIVKVQNMDSVGLPFKTRISGTLEKVN